ncbi:hypothetical protein GCM10009092_03130 [Bowmanella denitrificans]|uniref:Uncharacterized protein n=1 Tax=Bowmanella denitrificans TaxID=366582 RepID=A0ABP3GEN9_9ALTE
MSWLIFEKVVARHEYIQRLLTRGGEYPAVMAQFSQLAPPANEAVVFIPGVRLVASKTDTDI